MISSEPSALRRMPEPSEPGISGNGNADPQFGKIDQKNFVFNSGLMGVFEVGKA